MSVIFFCISDFTYAISNGRSLEILNEKGVAVAYVGTNSVISPEIVCASNLYGFCYISAQEDKGDYDKSDISLDVLIF